METFISAYLAVWFAVVIFVARMGIRQRQLQDSIESLQKRIGQGPETGTAPEEVTS